MTNDEFKKIKVALFIDRLIKLGGAEKVLDQFLLMFPKAPVYTTIYSAKGTAKKYQSRKIITSFLQKIPGAVRFERYLLPLFPKAIETFDFSKFDLVISDNYSFGQGIKIRKPTIHISYCHTPTRFLWHEYQLGKKKAGSAAAIFDFFVPYLRKWDRRAAGRPDFIVANSQNISQRIKKYFGREADKVIFPPVDLMSGKKDIEKEEYYLIISRLESHKKTDLAIRAFNQNEKNLKIIGSGQESRRLKKLARKNIDFLGGISDNEKVGYLRKAKALIFPQEEDFGIVACEAQMFGTPVIAYGKGGALETIKDGISGLFFPKQTPNSLNQAIKKFEKKKWNQIAIKNWAKKFNQKRFQKEWNLLIKKLMKEKYV